MDEIQAAVPTGRTVFGGRARWAVPPAFVLIGVLSMIGCSSETGYSKAFSDKTAINNNSHSFTATPVQVFKVVKITLIQQGFTIEQADIANGLIKAARTFEDPKKPKYSYLVTTSVDITGTADDAESVVTLSAGQQTILHKDSEKYFHLLGLVPIPTGKNYQTVVTKEGNVIDKSFYSDFFSAVGKNIAKIPPISAGTKMADPVPVPVPVAHTVDSPGNASPDPSSATPSLPAPSSPQTPTSTPTAASVPASAGPPPSDDPSATVDLPATAPPTASPTNQP
jgi:hypothetical protein